MNVKTIRKERFDDVIENEGSVAAYHGFNIELSADGKSFNVRTYDDEPGTVTVIAPTDALISPEATSLVTYLVSSMGHKEVKFYDPSQGIYRPIDTTTLTFKT